MSSKFPIIPIHNGRLKLDFGNGGIVAFVGKTGSGKTERLKQILRFNYKQFNYIMVMCPKTTAREYEPFIPKGFIKEYSEEMLTKLVDIHESIFESTGTHLRGGIIIDDCVGDPNASASNSPAFMTLAIRARKLGLTIFFLVQHWHTKLTTPLIRDAANYIFMTSALDSECQRMKDSVQSGVTPLAFKQMCSTYIREFSCLLFDNRGGSKNQTVCLPPYKTGDFKIKNFSE